MAVMATQPGAWRCEKELTSANYARSGTSGQSLVGPFWRRKAMSFSDTDLIDYVLNAPSH